MDDDHVLTVGQYIPEDEWSWAWGVQLSIFDVSDFANPTLSHKVVVGEDGGATSEALYNPKAFTYYAAEGLIALPVQLYGYVDIFLDEDGAVTDNDVAVDVEPDEGQADSDDDVVTEPAVSVDTIAAENDEFIGVVVYRVSAEAGFEELGRIDTQYYDYWYYWTPFTRGVFIEDDVFAVTNEGVRGAPVSDIASLPYELIFDREEPEEPEAVSPEDESVSDVE